MTRKWHPRTNEHVVRDALVKRMAWWGNLQLRDLQREGPNAKKAVHERSRYIVYVHNLLLDQQS